MGVKEERAEAAAYDFIRLVAREVVTNCSVISRHGGDVPFDGVMARLWAHICELTGVAGTMTITDHHAMQAVVSRGKISQATTRSVWDRDGWTCVHCGTHEDLSIDHIVPLARGGADAEANYQTLCRTCNSRKRDRLESEL